MCGDLEEFTPSIQPASQGNHSQRGSEPSFAPGSGSTRLSVPPLRHNLQRPAIILFFNEHHHLHSLCSHTITKKPSAPKFKNDEVAHKTGAKLDLSNQYAP